MKTHFACVRQEPVLTLAASLLLRYTTVPQYAKSLIRVCRLVCDLYGHRLGRSVKLDELYVALHKRLVEEIDFQVRTWCRITELFG